MLSEDFWRQWRRCAVQVDYCGAHLEPTQEQRHLGEHTWLALVVMHGQVQIDTGVQNIALTAEHFALIPPGVAWRRFASERAQVVHVWFQTFSPPSWDNPLLQCRLPAVLPFIAQDYLEHVLENFGGQPGHYSGFQQATAGNWFQLWLTECFHSAPDGSFAEGDAMSAAAPKWLHDALYDLVPNMSQHQWTVAGLARRAGVTPTYLAQTCRRYLRESPSAIMRRERVAFAVSLLRSRRLASVEEASNRLAYASPRAFWRQCMAETGHPPSYWLTN